MIVNVVEQLTAAMKEKNEIRKETIRAIKAAYLNWKTAAGNAGKEMTDADELGILKKMVKQRQDSIDMYIAGGRAELADKEQDEMLIIKEFLPEEVSEEQLESVMHELIRDKVADPIKKNMGMFIKTIKSKLPGADSKLISQVVSRNLN